MNRQERIAEIEAAAAQPGGLALRSVARLTDGQPDLLRALEAAAVPHWWEASTLTLVLDDDLAKNATTWFECLMELSVIEPFLSVPGAFNVHEVIRLALREKLHAEGRLPLFSARALVAVSQPTAEATSDRTIEQLYHQLVAEPKAGAETLEAAWDDWDNKGRWATLLDLAAMLEEVLPVLAAPARARALLRRAEIRRDRCGGDEIKEQFEESLWLFRQTGDEQGEGTALTLLGKLATAQGKLPEAQQLFTDGFRIRQRLAESNPANATWQRKLAWSLNSLGDVATTQGDLSEAQRLFGEAFRIRQQLAESDPANAVWQFDLGNSNERLGDVAAASGRLDEAHQYYLARHVIILRLAESDPANAAWQRDLSVSFDKLGDLATAEEDLPEAQQLFGEVFQIRQRLAESDPANTAWQRDLSVSFNKLGDLATAQGDLPEAQQLFGEAFRIRQRLAESDPANAAWQRDLSVSLKKLGDLTAAQGNLPEAQRIFGEDLRITQRLAESDPANADGQRDLSISLINLGDLAKAEGNLPEAHWRFAEALHIAQCLADSDPANADWQRDLCVSYWNVADVEEKLGSPDALTTWRKAYDTLAGMVKKGLFLSPADLKSMEWLRAKLNREEPEM